MGSDEYDEYKATVRVPKGEPLARSRDTPGAHRGFTHSGNRKLQHAEIFLTDEDEEYAQYDLDSEPEESDQLLGALVALALIVAASVAAPHLKRWWIGQALPFVRARWARLAGRLRVEWKDPRTVIEAAPVSDSEDVTQALDQYEASMTSEDARRHFVEALIARRFVEDKMRLLASVRIDDSAVPPELASAVQALTPRQVENTLNSMLATNPHLLDDLGKLLKAGNGQGPLQLGSGVMKEALRLIDNVK